MVLRVVGIVFVCAMKKLKDIQLFVLKHGVRDDDHVISVDFKFGTIIYTDKKNIVHYENNGHDGIEVMYE